MASTPPIHRLTLKSSPYFHIFTHRAQTPPLASPVNFKDVDLTLVTKRNN